MNSLNYDISRYNSEKMPKWLIYYRKYNSTKYFKLYYKLLYKISTKRNFIEISLDSKIGPAIYFAHAISIIICKTAIIGCNCTISKGVTIGQEFRGIRKGAPKLGNYVYVGINSTIVGNVTIGDDVLIASNTFVNTDIPSHSVVFGNPCIIKRKSNATQNYIKKII